MHLWLNVALNETNKNRSYSLVEVNASFEGTFLCEKIVFRFGPLHIFLRKCFVDN
jgi:hypothetical protein